MNNPLQIVYVLVSTEKDIYLEQAYVSMCSARKYNPDAVITVLTDELSAATFTGVRKKELRYADNIIVVKTPTDLNGQRRSRILKTSARKHVKGDFLFIDCDTIVAKPLDDILNVDAEIAACYDTHCVDFKENPYYPNIRKNAFKIGTPIDEEEHYFNSGVILVRDTPLAHKFYELWNQTLIESVKKKVFQDQPSFKFADYKLGHVLKPLPDIWNVELKHGIKYLKDANIVHYLCTNRSKNKERQFFIMNDMDVLMKIKKNAVIPQDVLETIEDPFCGLAPVCHCFAGEDIYFFRTLTYQHARTLYDSSIFPYVEWSISKYYNFKAKLSKIKKLLT